MKFRMRKDALRKAIALMAVPVILLAGCAPQARYLNIDVKKEAQVKMPVLAASYAVYSIGTESVSESVKLQSVALGMAEKLEDGLELERGSVNVYSIPKSEFGGFPGGGNSDIAGVDNDYLNTLWLDSKARVLMFVDNLNFKGYKVQKMGIYDEYGGLNVVLPYSVDLNVYDALLGKVLYTLNEKDSVYLHLESGIPENEVVGSIARYLPEISKKIGERLAANLAPQWITQQRLIVSYEGNLRWEEAYDLASDFKWREAIDIWMEQIDAKNPKKSAFAAYNIAVGCEMLEEFDMALKWIGLSLELYSFKEAETLKKQLSQKIVK